MKDKPFTVSIELLTEDEATPIRMTMVYDKTFSHFDGAVPHPFYVIVGGLEAVEAAVIFRYRTVKVQKDGSLVLAYEEVPEDVIEVYRKAHSTPKECP